MLGWCVTTGAGLAAYPIDTIKRRMVKESIELHILVQYTIFFVISIVDDDF